jgi:hypothetical protein
MLIILHDAPICETSCAILLIAPLIVSVFKSRGPEITTLAYFTSIEKLVLSIQLPR